MGSYSIKFKPSVEKDLRGLPKMLIARVMKQIEGLSSDSFPRHSVKLSGAERLYRIRAGDYRIVYEVVIESREIVIHYVRHRREVYRSS